VTAPEIVDFNTNNKELSIDISNEFVPWPSDGGQERIDSIALSCFRTYAA